MLPKTEPADDSAPLAEATSEPVEPVAADAADDSAERVGPADNADDSAERVEPATAPADGRTRLLVVLGVLAVLAVAAAVLAAIGNHAARANGPVANQAFADPAATAEVATQITAAVKTVYSYNFATLDADAAAAKQASTGKFAADFDRLFAPVKELAPKAQAVLTTAVPAAGVMQLRGDRARLLMMVDQSGTRAGQPIQGTTARLVVEAQRVDGQWKIAEVTPE